MSDCVPGGWSFHHGDGIEEAHDLGVWLRVRKQRRKSTEASCTCQAHAPSDEASVHGQEQAPWGSDTPDVWSYATTVMCHCCEARTDAIHRDDAFRERCVDRNDLLYMKRVHNHRTHYHLYLNALINIFRTLTATLKPEKRPMYSNPAIRRRRMKHSQKTLVNSSFHRIGTRRKQWSMQALAERSA